MISQHIIAVIRRTIVEWGFRLCPYFVLAIIEEEAVSLESLI